MSLRFFIYIYTHYMHIYIYMHTCVYIDTSSPASLLFPLAFLLSLLHFCQLCLSLHIYTPPLPTFLPTHTNTHSFTLISAHGEKTKVYNSKRALSKKDPQSRACPSSSWPTATPAAAENVLRSWTVTFACN